MAKNTKLAALRSAAKVEDKAKPEGKQQLASSVHPDVASGHAPRILPDLTNPPKDGPAVQTAQTQETKAAYFGSMTNAPTMPEGMNPDVWFAALTPQQQATVAFQNDVSNDLAAADDVQRSPLVWYFDLVNIYTVPDKTDPSKTVCLLDDFPIPDTDTGNNAAKVKETGIKKDGTVGTVSVDFYDKLPRSMSHGKALLAEIESLLAAKPDSGNPAKVKPEHASLSEAQRQTKYETAKKRWTRFKSTVKDAIWIRIQWAAIKGMPAVECDYVYDTHIDAQGNVINDNVTMGTAPFEVWPKGQRNRLTKTFSVSNFLKLNVEKANKNGGTFDALMKSVAKGTAGGTPTGDKGVPGILTVQTIMPFFGTTAAFFEDNNNNAAMLARAVKGEGEAGCFADDEVKSIGRTVLGLDPLWKHIQQRFQKLDKAERDAANKAREDKIASAA